MSKLRVAQDLINIFYPVGSYYETSNTSFNPNTEWGGTWVEDSKGRVTVSIDTSQTEFETIGKTGGSKALQKHTHTMENAGNHTHMVYSSFQAGGWDQAYASVNSVGSGTNNKWRSGDAREAGLHAHVIKESGTGTAGNLQPYVIVKRWHRTA